MRGKFFAALAGFLTLLLFCSISGAWTPLPVSQDPLVRMPGTQPPPINQADIEAPTRCLNCHGGFDAAVEPAFNWKGSMMAQAARDFIFWSCLTVAGQDAIWAVGNPNAVDICERCHFPKGWLEGRSDPPNASAMTANDYDGVQCDFCHSMYDPYFSTTYSGVREGSDWTGYWDETDASATPSGLAAWDTYVDDQRLSQSIALFNGGLFYTGDLPPNDYTENASGQYFMDDGRAKRASFADASARHPIFYSRYHKSRYMCATCHDVSNPVLGNLGADPAQILPTEATSAFSYFHVERTFSEFMLSDYGQPGGAPGLGPFDPSVYETSYADNYVAKCQDCHMRDMVGKAASQASALVRPNDSVEHPNSGQPVHDLTGGNAWVSWVVASAIPGSPNYDPVNDQILNQGAAVLTLDLNQGLGVDPAALLAGAERAKQQLLLAAAIQNLAYDPSSGHLSFRIQNQTGHKLISGFPEGRRMFINIKAYAGGGLIYEINPYDIAAGTLKGLTYPYQPDPNGVLPPPEPLAADEVHDDALVYEMKPTSSITGEEKSFHFALATGRYKDNRIPPKGFRIDEAAQRISVPVWHGVEDPHYFSNAEYDGGFDDVTIGIPPAADLVEVGLYYQTTSREYVEFLRDEINGTGNLTLTGTGAGGDEPYLVQADPFFAGLKAWGGAIWNLWTHNMTVPGASPFLMAAASVGVTPPACTAPVPTLLEAAPASNQVTLTWSDEHTGDGNVVGYTVYYDQSGKSQWVADTGTVTTYADTGLTNDNQYCYKVTSRYADCESGFSNIVCATPTGPGQTKEAGVTLVETGTWVTVGKGKNTTTEFQPATAFNAGDAVVIRAHVVDRTTALPLPNATVTIDVTGPETLTLTTGPSDAGGIAETTWNTQAPRRKDPGTTPGLYKATTTGLSAFGYVWDGVMTEADFNIQ
ncbi:MAG: fibronectin type III domain-containing protein [bacterium]|nr:MAG: fibronectin type III domain-containing protein [bacterium]